MNKYVLVVCVHVAAKYLNAKVPTINDFLYYVNLNHIYSSDKYRSIEARALLAVDYDLNIATVANYMELFGRYPWLIKQCRCEEVIGHSDRK